MTSNLFSKILPSASDDHFETAGLLQRGSRRSSYTDDAALRDIDEENFDARFEPQDVENLLADEASSYGMPESVALPGSRPKANTPPHSLPPTRPEPNRAATFDEDDDVPESLMLEGSIQPPRNDTRTSRPDELPPPVPGPSTRHAQAQWETTRQHQRLYEDGHAPPQPTRWGALSRNMHMSLDPKERALWRWVNVSDMDQFLAEVYHYFDGKGMYSILLQRCLSLLQVCRSILTAFSRLMFVVGFVTFLSWCIDYSRLPQSHKMSEVLVPKCAKRIHGLWILTLWVFIMFCLYSFVNLVLEVPRLKAMHDFYHHLLEIPDRDIQMIEWKHVVGRIMALRDQNFATAPNLSAASRKLLDVKSRQRLDAVDIASRLMRQDNYLISLFNKDILDVTIPVPFLGKRYIFSETTRWHVSLAVMDYVFSGPGRSFNRRFLRVKHRRDLVTKLQSRFLIVGLMSIVYAPFTVFWFLTTHLFRYFTEYHRDLSQLGARDWTPFALWKFREFNELPHLFKRRKNMAYPYANAYLAQFPKNKTEQLSAFVAFIVGAFAFVLFCITLLDSELFLNFEVTPGKTALFWIGVLTAVYAAARSNGPQDDQVPDPIFYLKHVIHYTHYEPASWKDKLHTDEVRGEFAQLYQPKILIFAEEILSMVITPYLLLCRLPACSERIVDFFREFSIEVDGLGVVCSHSVFPSTKGPEAAASPSRPHDAGLREDYLKTKDDKMLKSYYGFLNDYASNGKSRSPGQGLFHPPPQFPDTFGLMSFAGHGGEASVRTTGRDPLGRQALQHRTARLAQSRLREDPYNSALLDPPHQPAVPGIRSSTHRAPNARYQSPLNPTSDRPGLSRESSRVEEESVLGDSWRTGRLAEVDEEDEETAAKEAGKVNVLKLMQQYSKGQVDRHGAGLGL
ncbi:autophagy-related protein 9 [Sporormia fimetaria CBS 119925]|uniref:Autophagy-related protein 9 n=1 Tax=Sporormia fimetaria CBS 119925 TaxID=1340428 RepID=A0A6A6VA13_9PLEO|nr:autophagy-related protein 9 [Sporormia fimetaria CBS 119925]